MIFDSPQAYREYWKVHPAFLDGWNSGLDEYVDYDLRGIAPALTASSNARAVEEDSEDLFTSDLIATTLENLTEDVLMIRAVRGLQNEETPLYPEDILKATLSKYPHIKLFTVADVNHYGILLSRRGAVECANLIYGIKEGDTK